MTSKLTLHEVLKIADAMRRLESEKLELNVRGTLRWGQARRAIVTDHLDPFVAQVHRKLNGEVTRERAAAVEAEMLAAINGEEVELSLPAPIPSDCIVAIRCKEPDDFTALSRLIGVVIAEESAP